MGSDGIRRTIRALVLALAGGIIALAATHGLYATALLAIVVAAWTAVRNAVEQGAP